VVVVLVVVAGCATPQPLPLPHHQTFTLVPYDSAAPEHARVIRSVDGAAVETIDLETSTWASPTRSLVQAASGEQWLAVCEDYDAAQARCPHPIYIRVFPGAHVHRTTPP
jgi:hypothetical protein